MGVVEPAAGLPDDLDPLFDVEVPPSNAVSMPYDASSTGLEAALVPRWAEVGGSTELHKRIDGPDHARLVREMTANLERRGGARTLVIARYQPAPSLEGQSLDEIAATLGARESTVHKKFKRALRTIQEHYDGEE